MGTVIETEREVDLLMKHTGPSVELLIDTGHLTFAGGNVEATTRRHGARIGHVHCKDIRKAVWQRVQQEDMSFLDAVLEGVLRFPETDSSILRVLPGCWRKSITPGGSLSKRNKTLKKPIPSNIQGWGVNT